MKKKLFKRALLALALLYVIIFAARLVYILVTPTISGTPTTYNPNYSMEKEMKMINNYASLRVEYVMDGSTTTILDQKYERIANLTSRSTNFDSDMDRFNSVMQAHKAVIQRENRRGLEGSRQIDLIIGVRPENFDSMQEEISKIGKITSSTITKTDKTYEYRQMLAEKEILEKRKASYEELKKQGGSMSELLKLEETIIGVEAQIQQQLIGLGEFSDDNALCTINFSLYEVVEVSLLSKIWDALTWTTGTYAAILAFLIFVAFGAWILSIIYAAIRKSLAKDPYLQATEQVNPNDYPNTTT